MNHILNRYLPFLMKSPLFCLFWTLFGQFSGTFPIWPVSKSPWLLNWIIFWIESAEFFLNWIIFWIESWVKQYWIEYWMNHFLTKFKHWIESDRVSNTPASVIILVNVVKPNFFFRNRIVYLVLLFHSFIHDLWMLMVLLHWRKNKWSQHCTNVICASTTSLGRVNNCFPCDVNFWPSCNQFRIWLQFHLIPVQS